MESTHSAQVISALKQARNECGLTVQDVYNIAIEMGETISLTTVKRIFAEGSERQNFRYIDSLAPIERTLAAYKAEKAASELPPNALATQFREQIDYLKRESEKKDQMIARRSKVIIILAAALVLLMLAIIIVLFIDVINPDVGWFRGLSAIGGVASAAL